MYIFCLLQIIKCGFYTRIAGHIQTDIDSKTQNTVPVVNINVGEYSIENYNRHSYSHWHFRNQTRMTLRMTIQWNIKKFNKIHRYRLYFNVHGRYKQFPRWPLYAHTHTHTWNIFCIRMNPIETKYTRNTRRFEQIVQAAIALLWHNPSLRFYTIHIPYGVTPIPSPIQ